MQNTPCEWVPTKLQPNTARSTDFSELNDGKSAPFSRAAWRCQHLLRGGSAGTLPDQVFPCKMANNVPTLPSMNFAKDSLNSLNGEITGRCIAQIAIPGGTALQLCL